MNTVEPAYSIDEYHRYTRATQYLNGAGAVAGTGVDVGPALKQRAEFGGAGGQGGDGRGNGHLREK